MICPRSPSTPSCPVGREIIERRIYHINSRFMTYWRSFIGQVVPSPLQYLAISAQKCSSSVRSAPKIPCDAARDHRRPNQEMSSSLHIPSQNPNPGQNTPRVHTMGYGASTIHWIYHRLAHGLIHGKTRGRSHGLCHGVWISPLGT